MKTRTPGGAAGALDVDSVAESVEGEGEGAEVEIVEVVVLGESSTGAALLGVAEASCFWVGAEGDADADGAPADGATADGFVAGAAEGAADAPCAALLAFTGFVGIAAFVTTGVSALPSARAQLELATSATQTSPRTTPDMLPRVYSEAPALTTPTLSPKNQLDGQRRGAWSSNAASPRHSSPTSRRRNCPSSAISRSAAPGHRAPS
jgi:hypothetical protein